MATDRLETWRILRSKITHEDSWIQQRVSWLIAGNALLFAAYAALLGQGLNRGSALPYLGLLLLVLVPCIGFTLSVFVFLGLVGASFAIKETRNELERLVPDEKQRQALPTLYSQGPALYFGKVASWGATLLFVVVWLLLLGMNISSFFGRWRHW